MITESPQFFLPQLFDLAVGEAIASKPVLNTNCGGPKLNPPKNNMLKKYSLFFVCIFLLSCKGKNRTLSIRFANYTSSAKHITLTVSPLIEIDQDIEVLEVIPSWKDLGNFNTPKGMYTYSLKCEGVSKIIVDSFNLKDDSYFTVTLRDDLNKYERKDSLNINIIEKDSVKDFY